MVLWPSWAFRPSCRCCISLVSCSNSLIKRWLVRGVPPSRLCYRVKFPACLQEVGYLRCLIGLASLGDWRCSCLCFKLIPSIAERSALFVQELSFPHMTSTNDAFFNRNWAGASWNCCVGQLALDAGLLYKNKKPKGSEGARPLLLQCLSQFFPVEEKINCLENDVLCIPFTDGVAWYL